MSLKNISNTGCLDIHAFYSLQYMNTSMLSLDYTQFYYDKFDIAFVALLNI